MFTVMRGVFRAGAGSRLPTPPADGSTCSPAATTAAPTLLSSGVSVRLALSCPGVPAAPAGSPQSGSSAHLVHVVDHLQHPLTYGLSAPKPLELEDGRPSRAAWGSAPTPPPHPTPLGHHRMPIFAPCVIQQLPTCYLFYNMGVQVGSVTSVVSDSLRPSDCSPPGFSVHGIFLARILEWIAIPFSRVSS